MKRIYQVLSLVIVTLAVLLIALTSSPQCAEAKSTVFYEDSEFQTMFANMPVSKKVNITTNGKMEIAILSGSPSDVTMEMYDSRKKLVTTKVFSSSEADFDSNTGIYHYTWKKKITKDTYTFILNTNTSTNYTFKVCVASSSLDKKKATITKGFSTTFEVKGEKVTRWSSSNTKVATVKNGKVTGTGKGTATITALLKDGSKLTAKVTVEENTYTEKKKNSDNTKYGRWGQVTKAYYSNGSLKLKVRFINNTESTYRGIKKIKITVKDYKGRVIGVYKKSNIRDLLLPTAHEDYSFTIKQPKIRQANLRKAKVKVSFVFDSRK